MSFENFYDFTMGHARLTILRTLSEAYGHSSNDSMLIDVMQSFGLPVTRDLLRTQLGWLEEQGLIRLSKPNDALLVATLRERGHDVATGRARLEGVAQPTPAR